MWMVRALALGAEDKVTGSPILTYLRALPPEIMRKQQATDGAMWASGPPLSPINQLFIGSTGSSHVQFSSRFPKML